MNNICLSQEELVRYSQQIKLPEMGLSGQEQLKNARVLCVGLGGLGSPLLLYLAAAGVGTLGIVDDDVVDLSNLQRQVLYREEQIGQAKATAAAAQLLALNPSIQINSYSEKLNEGNAAELISQYDIIADGSDNFSTRYLIHDVCFKLKKPYVYASATHFQGYCSVFYGKPCLRCLFPIPPDDNAVVTCTGGGVIGVLPGIMGMIQATEIIKWITQIGDSLEKRLLIIDLLKMTFKEIQLSQNPDCSLCVHQLPLDALPHYKGCQNGEDTITAEDLTALLQRNTLMTLIDVRTLAEHEIQNIGGLLIPLAELPHRLQELNKNYPVILYCQSGKRSQMALKVLLDAGFSSVRYLSNGINEVLGQGRESGTSS